ncbi:erythromycin esterase family protein [Herbiconiux ginsengi]|uniref:Erythromycin esterase homolog n=1 Tax=Herbiconiux ginsengi TaxID=381665 RepID=A0A1H3SYS1_9MICO|nr:erythromycin esterase family protein [Herbiconiux ginsengi]SDZ42837.1 Erythromycin esterase homolog [Herbiconiux ginsengi]
MTGNPDTHTHALLADIRSRARPLEDPGLLRQASQSTLVCIGEASHGTHEFYRWRAEFTKSLVRDHGFRWIGVEGDWPDCARINRWLHDLDGTDRDARAELASFERWPTWLWANADVADFLDWLRDLNRSRSAADKVSFYGLDVYSLWDSLARIMDWLSRNAPEALEEAERAWACFLPFHQDPQAYGWATRLVPESCEDEVTSLLTAVLLSTAGDSDEDAFDAVQNAHVAAGAEEYYRAMMRGDRDSWNVRDIHMTDTIDRIRQHHGTGARGVVWEHNTHVGDARATDMAAGGLVNVGQLLRQRHPGPEVFLIGQACSYGTVLAADAWGVPETVRVVPVARPNSHEDLLGRALQSDAVLSFVDDPAGPWLGERRGHRAIGVVYRPEAELGNYVPTVMGERYDALVWFKKTSALRPLHHEAPPVEPEFETAPSGF